MASPFAVQSAGREAVDLLTKKLADRPADFVNRSDEMAELLDAINDPRFRDLLEIKAHERKNP